MKIRSLIAAAALVSLVGCAKDKPATGAAEGTQAAAPAAPAAPAAAPAPAAEHPIIAEVGGEAANVFRTRCGTCHGLSGKGDGAAAQALNPKPRSFEDAEWQGSITDDHIRTVIVKGGTAVGKSPLMAPNPDLEGKADVIDGLVKIVRGMKK
ncbi:MAG: hypothetical protein R3F65_12335 [bacterium]